MGDLYLVTTYVHGPIRVHEATPGQFSTPFATTETAAEDARRWVALHGRTEPRVVYKVVPIHLHTAAPPTPPYPTSKEAL